MTIDLPSFSACDALVAVMVAVSASDETMRTSELLAIERMVDHTPVFASYDAGRIRAVAHTVFSLFEEEDGLDALFRLIRAAVHDTPVIVHPEDVSGWPPEPGSSSGRARSSCRRGRCRGWPRRWASRC